MSLATAMQPADADARREALDPTRSFCVQAPAGSGKTELLTQRILKLLTQVGEPEAILAFTFTRKAAGEMRQRLLDALLLAATIDPDELPGLSSHRRLTLALAEQVLKRDRALGWQLMANTQRLRIMTIDSFNHSLTAQLPLAAAMGGPANITDDMTPVFSRAIHRLFDHLENDTAIAPLLRVLLAHLHNNLREAEAMLIGLLEKREQWLPLVLQLRNQGRPAHELLADSLQIVVGEQQQRLVARLSPYLDTLLELLDIARFSADNLADNPAHPSHTLAELPEIPDAEPVSLGLWRDFTAYLMTSKLEDFRKVTGLNKNHGFPPKTGNDMKARFGACIEVLAAAGLQDVFREIAGLPDPAQTPEREPVLNALVDLLPLLASELMVAMREAGVVDYTQTTLSALQALGAEDDPSELALKLDYQLQHILVDEFQDTSVVQLQLLQLLTRGWTEGDGRTLFIVGDGMQSCYGFRNARVSLFLQVRDTGIGDIRPVPLALEVNFRSDAAVVNGVNAVFSRVFPPEMDMARGGVPYSPSSSRDPEVHTAGLHLDLWIREPDQDADKVLQRKTEADAVIARVLALQLEDSRQHIAILVRNRRDLSAIIPRLREANLKFNATEIDPLLSYPQVNDLFTLLCALINAADEISWAAVLRSPMIGLRLEDLAVLADQACSRPCSYPTLWSEAATLPAISPDARQRLEQSWPVIRHAMAQIPRKPLRVVLEETWIDLGGPHCLGHKGLLPNIAAFLALAEKFDAASGFNLSGFSLALGKAYGNVTDPEVRLTIQTIHKAKGLEYDAVLIPGLHRRGGGNDNPLLLWQEYVDSDSHAHPIVALLPQTGAGQDSLYAWLKSEAGLRDRHEATRLLYIAVTRAIRSAWLFGEATADDNGTTVSSGTLLETIAGLLDDPPAELDLVRHCYAQSDTGTEALQDQRLATQPLLRMPAGRPATFTVPGAPEQANENEEDSMETGYRHLLQREIGELVHLALQHVTLHGTGFIRSGAFRSLVLVRLGALCEGRQAQQEACDQVLSQLDACLACDSAEWLFLTPHAEAASELAMSDYRYGYRRDYVLDRTFIDATGTRWIIDYKSSSPPANGGLEEFIAAETTRYLPQLQSYASLFADRPEPVRIALFFTALARLHPL